MSVQSFVEGRRDAFIAMRRDFHMYPEPGWLEYRSAAKVAARLIELGYDVAIGADVLNLDARMGLPGDEIMKTAMNRAVEEGADPELVEKIRAETDAASLLAPEEEQKEKDYSRSLF